MAQFFSHRFHNFFNHLISRIFLKEENLLRHFRVTYAFRDMTSTTKRRVGISKVNLTFFQDKNNADFGNLYCQVSNGGIQN